MKSYVRLSWDIEESTPLYPGTPPVNIKPIKSIQQGDSCNTSQFLLSGHTGTHVDFPRHFLQHGRSSSDYGPEDLIFHQVLLLDCPKKAGEVIHVGDLQIFDLSAALTVDLVLVRTGFSSHRKSDPLIYASQNPCLSPEAAMLLRKNLPVLKGFGIDCISVSSPMHRELGRETHRILFDENSSGVSPIIIEDLMLPEAYRHFDEVIVAPLPVQNADGVPCSALGIIND